ncbi:MAG: TspO/MBR family protein [Pyrinomonadaceae bacterium]
MLVSSIDAPAHTGSQEWLGLAFSVAVCFAAAGLGSLFTRPAIPGWYARLAKPSWTPPAWLFGPVWTLLYLLMAVAAWLVWREHGFAGGAAHALVSFAVQLCLNVLWSVIFFGWKRKGLALAEIVLLWLAILTTTIAFHRLTPAAGWLMSPYLAWVSFAALLNFSIWRKNERAVSD